MTLGIWFGQFNITGGQVEEEGPFIGIFEGARQAAGVGVYVVAEPVSGAPPRLCDEVLEVIARAFGNPEVALTANLLRAVAAAHDHVRAFNRMRSGDRAVGVGLSCLATRRDEAYLAQCGPTLVVANAGGRFRVAAPTGDDSRRPLGFGDRAAPVFTRFSLHPGDVMVLTFSAADKLLGRGNLIGLASSPPEEALPDLFLRARASDDFAALYLGVIEQPVAVEASHAGRIAPRPSPYPPAGPGAPPPMEGQRQAARVYAADDPVEPGWREEPPPRQPAVGTMRERMSQSASLSRQAAQRALASLGGGTWQPSRRAIYLALGVAALLLVLVIAVPALAERGTDGRYADLLHRASGSVIAARQEANPGRRRELLNQAEADLIEAMSLSSASTEAEALLSEVSHERTALDAVRQLAEPLALADLTQFGIAVGSALEIAVAGEIYILDTASGKVHGFAPEPGRGPEIAFEEGRTIAGVRTGKARHLTLLSDGRDGAGVLLVLDSNRRLFARSAAGGWQLVPLGDTALWKSDTGIAAAAGALYCLDAQASQVWRFSGDLSGYEGKPEPLVSRANLKDSVAISVSATPMVATTSGKLLRIADGTEQEFTIAGVDRPLIAPSAPIFHAADGSIYIPDRGNARVVVAAIDGTYKGQLVQRRLSGLRALAFDEAGGVFYAVSGGTLLRFRLER